MPAIAPEKKLAVIEALGQGGSYRAIERATGVNQHAVKRIAEELQRGIDVTTTDTLEIQDGFTSAGHDIHDVCKMFPEMSKEELDGLAADIAENGLHEPIWTHQGKIIDGRNRHMACLMAGVEPRFREWDGNGSLVGFVCSLNLHRRHLTPGQRAAIAVEIKPKLAEEIKQETREKQVDAGKETHRGSPRKVSANNCEDLSKPDTRDARIEAAKLAEVNHSYVSDAERIKEESPETFEEVKQGKKTIPQAKRQLGLNTRVRKPSIPLYPTANGTPDPAHADDPPDVAAGRRNGTIPADAVVEVTEVGEGAETTPPPPEMTDEEYLESLPARPQLAEHVRKRFDVEAILFRRVTPLRLKYARACKPLTNAAKKECQGHIGPWMGRHFWYLRSNDPSRWQACKDCKGSGSYQLIGDCPTCKGEGYHA